MIRGLLAGAGTQVAQTYGALGPESLTSAPFELAGALQLIEVTSRAMTSKKDFFIDARPCIYIAVSQIITTMYLAPP
jgi:hypothetical protein